MYGWGRGLVRADPRVVDAVLAVSVFASACVVGSAYTLPGYRPFDALAFLLTGLGCLPLAARRVAPVPVLLVTSAGYAIHLGAGYPPNLSWWGPVLAFYSLSALKPPRTTAFGAVLLGVLMLYSGLAMGSLPVIAAVTQGIVVPAVAWSLGGLSRRLAQRNAQLAEVTAQLRREQELNTRRALTEERLRIARELHDVVAHHMSVVTMQAGLAGYVFDEDPPTARSAVDAIATAGREALQEMRHLLHLLRAEDGTRVPEPAPGLAQLPVLAGRLRGAGVDVEMDVAGEIEALPPGLQLTVYRVIQEALTNVLKHARPGRAKVELRLDQDHLTAVITNPLGPSWVAPGAPGGKGLIGMRERAGLYGGTLVAGPRGDGGFAVELTMPVLAT